MDVKIVVSDLARRHKDNMESGIILQNCRNIINKADNLVFAIF